MVVKVEIDESKFGRVKYNRGHFIEGQWAFVDFERDGGRIFMIPVGKRDRTTLLLIIREWFRPGTKIYSDYWKAYYCLSDIGYQHSKLNYSLEFVNSETEARTEQKKYISTLVDAKRIFIGGYLANYILLKHCRMLKV